MHVARIGWVIVTLLVAAPGCAARIPEPALSALEGGAAFELFSLDPSAAGGAAASFHDWQVLGSMPVTDRDLRGQLISALKKATAAGDGEAAACFHPRHGIRTVHDGRSVDLVICFECSSTRILVDGKPAGSFQLTASAQPVFDGALRTAGVTLAAPSAR
jgi:hypothetical protein